MKKLVIIPAFNEEDNILNVVKDIHFNAPNFDILVINDNSSDNTLALCKKNHIPILNLPFNLGIGGAVQSGYLYAYYNNYDIAVQLDGDGQHDAKFLNALVDRLLFDNADMVIGSRFIEYKGYQSSMMRRLGIRWFSNLIMLLTGKRISDPTSGYRLCNRGIIKLFSEEYPKDYPEPETLIKVINNKMIIVESPVVMRERQGGKSSISLIKSVYYMSKVSLSIFIEYLRR